MTSVEKRRKFLQERKSPLALEEKRKKKRQNCRWVVCVLVFYGKGSGGEIWCRFVWEVFRWESLYSDIFQQAWQWRMVAEGLRWGGYGKDGGDFGSIEKRHWLL